MTKSQAEIDAIEFMNLIKVDAEYCYSIADVYLDPNGKRLTLTRIWEAGARALFAFCEKNTIKPEPNSVTQFEPFITIDKMREYFGEG